MSLNVRQATEAWWIDCHFTEKARWAVGRTAVPQCTIPPHESWQATQLDAVGQRTEGLP
jgi:hypothetical protein